MTAGWNPGAVMTLTPVGIFFILRLERGKTPTDPGRAAIPIRA